MQTPGNTPTAPEFNFELSGGAAKCNTPTAPEFNFKLSGEAAKHYDGNTPTAPEFNFELSSEATKCNTQQHQSSTLSLAVRQLRSTILLQL
jgi:hypothetical protein